MDETKYSTAFQLITSAGNARSCALMAIEAAREFDFSEAQTQMENAQTEMYDAHRIQTEMIQKEAAGEEAELNIILVHAQDHLTMAIETTKNAEEFIHLYKVLKLIMTKTNIDNLIEE